MTYNSIHIFIDHLNNKKKRISMKNDAHAQTQTPYFFHLGPMALKSNLFWLMSEVMTPEK